MIPLVNLNPNPNPIFPQMDLFFFLHPLARAKSKTHFRQPATKNISLQQWGGGGGCIFKYHLCGGFKSMESYHLFFVDVFVKPSCSLPDPEPLNAIEISISSSPRVKCHNAQLVLTI